MFRLTKLHCRYVLLNRSVWEHDKVSGVLWILVEMRTIQQSRSRAPSTKNRPLYRVFRHNGVRYSETYMCKKQGSLMKIAPQSSCLIPPHVTFLIGLQIPSMFTSSIFSATLQIPPAPVKMFFFWVKTELMIFWILWSYKQVCLIVKNNSFRGDLNDISAKMETLPFTFPATLQIPPAPVKMFFS